MRPYTQSSPYTPLALLANSVRRIIPSTYMAELYEFDEAWKLFNHALTNIRMNITTESFRELNGRWARMHHLMLKAEEKYGELR